MAKGLRDSARRFAVAGLSLPIHLYRYCLSPLLPSSCRFAPSCSAYALESLSLHGPVKGSWLAIRRLSRCHPIEWLGGSAGHDPVPPTPRATADGFSHPHPPKPLAKAGPPPHHAHPPKLLAKAGPR